MLHRQLFEVYLYPGFASNGIHISLLVCLTGSCWRSHHWPDSHNALSPNSRDVWLSPKGDFQNIFKKCMDQASWFGNKIPARLKLPSQPIPGWNYLSQLEGNIFPSSGFPSHLTLRISRAVWRFPRAVPHPFSVSIKPWSHLLSQEMVSRSQGWKFNYGGSILSGTFKDAES